MAIREVLMGVGDGVASVIMLTFTKRPGPHAHFYIGAQGLDPCSQLVWSPAPMLIASSSCGLLAG